MDELITLRQFIEQGRYNEALLFIDELEEMSKEDKLNKIFSYVLVLLIYLIKKQAEQRTTRSWEVSIIHAVHQIKRTNVRRKSGGVYAQRGQLAEILEDAFDLALKKASLEVFKGKLDDQELATKINQASLIQEALNLISDVKSWQAVKLMEILSRYNWQDLWPHYLKLYPKMIQKVREDLNNQRLEDTENIVLGDDWRKVLEGN